MGGGDEGGAQETGPVTVRKLLFRDGSLFAGDEAGSLCRWRPVPRRKEKSLPSRFCSFSHFHFLRWSPNLELENKMEYYTEIWSMAIDNAAKVDKSGRI